MGKARAALAGARAPALIADALAATHAARGGGESDEACAREVERVLFEVAVTSGAAVDLERYLRLFPGTAQAARFEAARAGAVRPTRR